MNKKNHIYFITCGIILMLPGLLLTTDSHQNEKMNIRNGSKAVCLVIKQLVQLF